MSTILVADDERGTRRIVKQLLEKEGHEVLEASDGTSAYELAMSEGPDIGVLDVRMPGMDGFEVLRRLKQHPDTETMPIVMLTSIPVEKGEATAASFGASHYVPKPLTRIHRRTSLGTVLEEAIGCSSESGIMVLEQKPARKQGGLNRCCHRTNPTVSASSLTTIAWWPMPACSYGHPSPAPGPAGTRRPSP